MKNVSYNIWRNSFFNFVNFSDEIIYIFHVDSNRLSFLKYWINLVSISVDCTAFLGSSLWLFLLFYPLELVEYEFSINFLIKIMLGCSFVFSYSLFYWIILSSVKWSILEHPIFILIFPHFLLFFSHQRITLL